MKRIIRILSLLLLCCLAQPHSVRADVIYEPMDSFYEEFRDECEYNDRNYIANGPNGDVTVYESPKSDNVRTTIQNGEEMYISYTYCDALGIEWGCWENWQLDVSGWVPMDYLNLIYDGVSFDQDHGHEFQNEEGTLPEKYAGQIICFWEYPGSTECWKTTYESGYAPEYDMVYTDANGQRWGRVGYYMSFEGWINLDDPTADYETLYPDVPSVTGEPTQPAETSSTEPVEEIVPQELVNSTMVILAVLAVAAVVTVTGVLLVKLKWKQT